MERREYVVRGQVGIRGRSVLCSSRPGSGTVQGRARRAFSLHAGTAIESKVAERVGRYLTRAPVALGEVFPAKDGRVKLLTPRDPTTGRDHRMFDPLDWVHAVATQIPDPRQHMVRYYGAWANRARQFALAAPVTPSLPS